MQSLSLSFSRSYRTRPTARLPRIPELAAVARTASTPLAVRLRRQKKTKRVVGPGEHDATPDGLTPSEYQTYSRQRQRGELPGRPGWEQSPPSWLDHLNKRRSRIRGIRENQKGEEVVVGQKVYLPNVIFRLVRNHTPAGQPYNPYEATFRIPQSITKTDIRSYLQSVYGVKTTYIRTDNYFSPLFRAGPVYKTRAYRTYKRAVVGLVDPFYYPQAMEDMPEKEREERKAWIEESFHIEESKQNQKWEYLRATRAAGPKWRWRGSLAASRKAILTRVVAQRYRRDAELVARKETIQQKRQDNIAAQALAKSQPQTARR
ncbi:hypothetical protein PLICRDRAFT_301087 [Plicaturopsis crispa FD-325 SS-3]|nr:hypothetical protein PLICRDRAFT_301087 [Plicaturopsis crispa FD-325 SS-3]